MSVPRGYLAYLACYLAFAMAMLPFVATAYGPAPETAEPDAFAKDPKDRPVLETPQQVREARATGVGAFWFDGVYHVVDGLPKHYVDYSSWYVRMP